MGLPVLVMETSDSHRLPAALGRALRAHFNVEYMVVVSSFEN